jgi:hypothetical protein
MESFGPAVDSMTDKEINFYIDIISLKQIFIATQCPPLAGE